MVFFFSVFISRALFASSMCAYFHQPHARSFEYLSRICARKSIEWHRRIVSIRTFHFNTEDILSYEHLEYDTKMMIQFWI